MTMLVLICGSSEPSWIVPRDSGGEGDGVITALRVGGVDCFAQRAVAAAAWSVIVIVHRGDENRREFERADVAAIPTAGIDETGNIDRPPDAALISRQAESVPLDRLRDCRARAPSCR